ncbi:MAG: peptide chain release factor N(5)-glutamine methyltransferase [Bacteroidales bacterium]|nr:peptide chain release factor N(5)-glutamine methyltransferase [Bacteroidales bacterium]
MEVISNKIGDIRSFYKRKLFKDYDEREADIFLYMLLDEFCGLTKAEIFLDKERLVNESQLLKVHFGVKDLLNHKPIQYILGKAEFYGLPFIVNPDVLIPRPETEELVDWIIKENLDRKEISIMEIGTGSGCIAITLKKNIPDLAVDAVDLSISALAVAKKNAVENNVEVNFKQLDILDSKSRTSLKNYDIIVSNPPYVRNSEKKAMKKNVLDYEPATALFVDDSDPLLFYKAIANFAKLYLRNKGCVYCEINQYLAKETAQIFTDAGFKIIIKTDLNGNDRMLKAF